MINDSLSEMKQNMMNRINHVVEMNAQSIRTIIDNYRSSLSTEFGNEHPTSNTSFLKSKDTNSNLQSDQSSLKSDVIVGNRNVTIPIQKNVSPNPPLMHHPTSATLEEKKPPIRKHLEKRVDVEQNVSQIRNLSSKYFYSANKI